MIIESDISAYDHHIFRSPHLGIDASIKEIVRLNCNFSAKVDNGKDNGEWRLYSKYQSKVHGMFLEVLCGADNFRSGKQAHWGNLGSSKRWILRRV